MTSLLCDFGLRGKRNKRFQEERERERECVCVWVLQNSVWAREKFLFYFSKAVLIVDTSFFKATVRLDAQIPNSYQIPNS